MTIDDFERAARLTRSSMDTRTMSACRLVVDGWMNIHAAARACGVSHPTVYRKLAELRAALALPVCEACGRPTTTKHSSN
jgi:DNA-binding transcriptional LysR family regulator